MPTHSPNDRHPVMPKWVAAMPAWSLSLLTPVPFFMILLRENTRATRLILAAYSVLWAAVVTILVLVPENDNGWRSELGGFSLIGLAAAATTHAFVLRERFSTPVTRPVTDGVPPSGPANDDAAVARRQWRALRSRVDGDTLPQSVRPAARAVLAYLDKVIAYVENGGHADTELRETERILGDYLPTSIDTYLRLPSGYARTQHNGGGRTALQELELQLNLLEDATAEAANSIYRDDAQRLEVQSRFLQDKFGRSELDLP